MPNRDLGLVIDQTQGATIDGYWQDTEGCAGLCIQSAWTGTLSGTLTLEGRNDSTLNGEPITEVTLSSPAGSAGGQLTNIGNAQARFYRVRYTHVGGTGGLKVSMGTKVQAL
jgi:hypothetical protein